jgi:hypothetical protein
MSNGVSFVYFALETQREREYNNFMVWYNALSGDIRQVYCHHSINFCRDENGNIMSTDRADKILSKYASALTLRCLDQRKELQRIVEIIKSTTEIIDDIVYNILQHYLLLA